MCPKLINLVTQILYYMDYGFQTRKTINCQRIRQICCSIKQNVEGYEPKYISSVPWITFLYRHYQILHQQHQHQQQLQHQLTQYQQQQQQQ